MSEPITLPEDIRAALEAFCQQEGELPADVIADAILLHLDELGEACEK